MQEAEETWVRSLGREDPLERVTATRPSILRLGSAMDRGAWQPTVPGVTTSWTRLNTDAHRHISTEKKKRVISVCVFLSISMEALSEFSLTFLFTLLVRIVSYALIQTSHW